MPTYAYACTACDHRFEAQQAFSDDALTECPQCEGRLRKLFNSVGIVFKGSGFYRTDSRSGSSSATGSTTPVASGTETKSTAGDSGSSSKATSGESSSSGSSAAAAASSGPSNGTSAGGNSAKSGSSTPSKAATSAA